MYTVFLTGGIASGKSTVAQLLGGHGALVVSLDELSREVLAPGAPVLTAIAEAFGADVLAPDGSLRRDLLARRAFANPEGAARLEALELPYLSQLLEARLRELRAQDVPVVVVEVPLLDRAESLGMTALADEVLAVVVPRSVRERRAIGRGMSAEDFAARDALQPSEAYLCEHADETLANTGGEEELRRSVETWWHARAIAGVLPPSLRAEVVA